MIVHGPGFARIRGHAYQATDERLDASPLPQPYRPLERSKERDQIEFEIGGGAARAHLDTGSGRIRIAAR